MNILLALSRLLLLIGFIPLTHAKTLTDKKYPRILEVEGVVLDLAQRGSQPLNKKDRILESFHPVTQAGSRILIEINADLTVEVYENSDLFLPAISWETRQVSEIRLLKGQIQVEAQKKQKFLKVKSELFESEILAGNFIYEVDHSKAQARLMVIQGEMSFGALNADEIVKLESGQKVVFQAVKENNEFVFDLLLKGRKVPKGQLGSVEAVSAELMKAYSRHEKRNRELQKKIKLEKALALSDLQKQDAICHAPRGKLNQCVWRIEKNKCIRRRCTADGLWKDPHEVGQSYCQRRAQAQLCDY
jgi:hypothetical protein